jgi:biopolymer transport protein ExbD
LVYINNDLVGLDNISNYLKKLPTEEISSIIISADSSANHGTVATAMSIAKQVGAQKFSIITKD